MAEEIRAIGVRQTMALTKMSQHTIEKLLRGEAVRRKTQDARTRSKCNSIYEDKCLALRRRSYECIANSAVDKWDVATELPFARPAPSEMKSLLRECEWKHGDSGHSAGEKNLAQS
jgi:hypothetical protein